MQFRMKALAEAGADGSTWFAAAAWPGNFYVQFESFT
jgi:hypothetical protein